MKRQDAVCEGGEVARKAQPMRYPGNVVTPHDTRSGYPGAPGSPTCCLYCSAKVGGPHKEDCVCIKRPVNVRVTFDLVIERPRSWDGATIELHMNDSSWPWSMDSILEDIKRQIGAKGCACTFAKAEYVSDATVEEAIAAGLEPDEVVAK